MIGLTLGEMARWGQARLQGADASQTIAGVTIDSRETGTGQLFVALPGRNVDGHQFVPEAWARGAVALVRQDFPLRDGPLLLADSPLEAMGRGMRGVIESRGIVVVGVTGSAGKTSIKELVRQGLTSRFVTGMTHNNFNTAIGLPLSFFASSAAMTHFVAEMAMRGPGEIRHLTTLAPPDIAIISNIGMSHLEKLGSMEAIAAAKGEILEGLKPGGTAILNYDDERVRRLGELLPENRRVLWYGLGSQLDAAILHIRPEPQGLWVNLRCLGDEVEVHLPWLGRHQAYNVAAALLAGVSVGIEPGEMASALDRIDPARSRIQRETVGTLNLIVDIYNASPASMAGALGVLAQQPARKVAVLGDMLELGSGEVSGHREVGIIAARSADLLITVGERAREIGVAATEEGLPTVSVTGLDEAERELRARLMPADAVLFKASRGMAFERLVQRVREWGGPP